MSTTVEPTADVAPPSISTALLLDIADGLARARSLWEGRVEHAGSERHAVRLLAHPAYEAWVIGWPPGHRTTPHDHGGSHGAVVVVDGSLLEQTGGPDEPWQRHGPGDAFEIAPDAVHDVGTAPGGWATSIHVYAPPLSTMTFYEDGTGLPDHVLDVAPEPPVHAAGIAGRLLHPAGSARRG